MSVSTAALYLSLLATFTYITYITLGRRKRGRKQPPGPWALPIIGNLHNLGPLPHRNLESLAKLYGPIMTIWIGDSPNIVLSSPEAAKLFLKNHDTVFANRPTGQASRYLIFAKDGASLNDYGVYWRSFRKLCNLHLLSTSKVESFAPIRKEESVTMVKSIEGAAKRHEIVDVREKVEHLTENITYKIIAGRNSDDLSDLKRVVLEALGLAGTFNVADYLPWLGKLDIQGLNRRLKETGKALNDAFDKIIDEHEPIPSVAQEHHKDFIHVLLSLMNQSHQPSSSTEEQQTKVIMDRSFIKDVLLQMIAGAFETSATVIEWCLSALLKHPTVLEKLQDELANVVGMNRMVEETDLSKLSYLDMVVKETLRLYPVAPLLVPHESREDIVVDGYYIKKNSRLLVNLWAMGRDPQIWFETAHDFVPERFLHLDVDLRGNDFQFIPFGSGRRMCPGMQLGLRTVKFVLAQLVHCFKWELPGGMAPRDLDMKEKFNIVMRKEKHLLAVPSSRLLHQSI